MEVRLIAFSIWLSLYAMVLNNVVFELLFEDVTFVKVMLIGLKNGAPLLATSTQAFTVPGVV